MKVKIIFLLFSLFFINQVSVALVVSGQTSCEPDITYSYTVVGADLSKSITWNVSGGSFVGSAMGLTVVVKWNSNVQQGSITVSGTSIVTGWADSGRQTVSIFGEPIVSNMSISTSSPLSTYKNINLNLNYSSSNDIYDKTITWSIDNAGTIKTLSGKSVSVTFDKIGQTTITATLKYVKGSKSHTVSRTVNIADGTLDPPNVIGIIGETKHDVGGTGYFLGEEHSLYPNIKYEWVMTNYADVTIIGNEKMVSYRFAKYGDYMLKFTATNTKTGQSSSQHRYLVAGRDLDIDRIIIDPEHSFNVVNSNIFVSTTNNEAIVMNKNIQNISYFVHNMLTGILVDKGSIINGSSIDTNKLPKGMYVLKLNDGTKEETHKFTVR